MMPESHDSRSVVDLAEQAAAAGDYVSAEQFLREAVRLHEAESGPVSSDLANTLNNLGVVSEMRNNTDEAELCYRRAYEIAAATLPADHPFVATSRKNLADLRAARGKPIEAPPASQQAPAPDNQTPRSPISAAERTFPVATVILSALVLGILATIAMWPAPSREPASPRPAAPLVNAEPPSAAVPIPVASPPADARSTPAAEKREPARRAATPAGPAVITARLCRSLSINRSSSATEDWPCDTVTGQAASGPLFFYTRLKATRDTTVQHRWYHDETLYQSVELPVRANQTRGFRTYSRYTMKNGSSGNWRVELRSNEGTLLHQEQFAVR